LLTFFILLLSFAKTESAKYEAALGSLRDAFGGNVLQKGEVIQRGKSADSQFTMMESQESIKPFPIEFLTSEGLLDKLEVNRESTEELNQMKKDLADAGIPELADIYETPEGVRVVYKEKILFKKGTVDIESISVEAFEKLVQLVAQKNWTVFVQGHAQIGERSLDGIHDAMTLSSLRAGAVSRSLIKRGIPAKRITTVYYADSRPIVMANRSQEELDKLSRRVEFILRKVDLNTEGRKVESR
jgi:chemotaxis protein MotB